MSLKDIALPLALRGIRVVPAAPGDRMSKLPGWPTLATTDVDAIEEWDKRYPDWNLVCVSGFDDVCIVDIDDIKAAYNLGLPKVPDTFTVKSPKGYHVYFLHNERSRLAGNRVVQAVAELKGNKLSCAAPGCTRADGGKYVVCDDSPLVEIPDSYLDWFDTHDPKTTHSDGQVPVSEDFDYDHFLSWVTEITGCDILGSGQRRFPRPCIIKEDFHHSDGGKEDPFACGFNFDGEFLTWKSLAANCDGANMSIGKVIKFLNEKADEKGEEPYDGPIWDKNEELDISQFADDEVGEDPKPVPEQEAPVAVEPEPANALSADDFIERVYKLKYPHLRFPYEAMPEGRLKMLVDKTCEGGLSAGLTCPAILTLISSLPQADVMEGARINLFMCLLALVGAGKDTAIDRALAVLGLTDTALFTAYSPSGERSIALLLGDKPATKDQQAIPGHRRHTIITYELEDTLNKSKGETSSVLQALQWYYDHNRKIYTDTQRGKTQTVDCRLSWLTALPVGSDELDEDRFRFAFGDQASGGFTSRMLFGFSEERFDRRRTRNWVVDREFYNWSKTEQVAVGELDQTMTKETIDTMVSRIFRQRVTGFAPGVEEQYLDWKPSKDMSGRDTYHILKLAVVIALAYDHDKVEQSDWDFAVEFMTWQTAIRIAFAPGKAKTVSQAQFNEIVIREVEKRTEKLRRQNRSTNNAKIVEKDGEKQYYIRWKGMANSNRWWRFGVDVEKSIDGLVRNAALSWAIELETSVDGKSDKLVADKKWVRLQD